MAAGAKAGHLPAIPDVWVINPQRDSPGLRAAIESMLVSGEELWLVSDAVTVKQIEVPHLLVVTSLRLGVIDMAAAPLIQVPAASLSLSQPFPSELVLTRSDTVSRADRKLVLGVAPQAVVLVKDRIEAMLAGARPARPEVAPRQPLPEGVWLKNCFYLGGHGLPIQAR